MHSAPGSAMLTDLYQITMAQGYHTAGLESTWGCFHLSFRENPFGGGFAVACGLEQAVSWLESWAFSAADVAYLASCTGADGAPLFTEEFLGGLIDMRLNLDVDAVAEGTVVFPGEPLVRVCGPLPHCQLVETALLNAINFHTLIATKAARCRLSARQDPLLEFGLRRAQGPDGGVSASRAAYIGGCDSTSNVLAAQQFGIPVAGTHAHSWVMAFDGEQAAFDAYVRALPNNATLLVDTYDTLEGVRRAVRAGEWLRAQGQELLGIRIDSGDLAWLSREARRMLDDAGFTSTRIVASNELDEYLIASLKEQGARIDVWGVGTKLVTGWGQPALGGVYKLSAIKPPGREWTPRIKLSEQTAKITTPGVLGIRRFMRPDGSWAGDMIYDTCQGAPPTSTMIDPADQTRRKTFDEDQVSVELLEPIMRGGVVCWEPPAIAETRSRAIAQVAALDPSIRRFMHPHAYPVGLERSLHDLRSALVLSGRGIRPDEAVPSAQAIAQARAAQADEEAQ